MANWYKLDNAAKIFPAIYKKTDTNSFRISAVLNSEVNSELLYSALNKTLKRFPTFCVRIKRGFFWYYFDHNYSELLIKEENVLINDSVRLRKNNGYMFSLSYYEKRLTLEIFHALTDGTGALEFFKAILFNYLNENNVQIKNDGSIVSTDLERNLLESQDSFNLNYDKKYKKASKEAVAYQIKGTFYNHNWCGLIHAFMDLDKIKAASKKYNATITQYISALILYSVYENFYRSHPTKQPIRIFIPVNARKYFDSVSMRNFALFIRTTTYIGDTIDLAHCIEYVKDEFNEQLNKETLEKRISANVGFEKSVFVRILPLFIKKIGMKIGFKVLGSNANTITYSNLGKVILPEEMNKYINQFEFSVSAVRRTPINVTSISYGNTFSLTFITKLIEKGFMKTIFELLDKDGVSITLETNDLEVE